MHRRRWVLLRRVHGLTKVSTALTTLTLVLVLALAFANGTNDVLKAIATLVGSGATTYRTAIAWGTLWTMLGVATAMAKTFSIGFSSPTGFGLLNGRVEVCWTTLQVMILTWLVTVLTTACLAPLSYLLLSRAI